MQAIQNRLLHIENEFISSLADSSSSDFICFESKFRDDIQRAIPDDQVNDEILELANAIITRSSLVVHQFFLLDQKDQELTESLHNEVEEVLSRDELFSPKSHSKSTIPSGPPSLPPYIAPAYQWLMENLHCPYPSVAKKDSLAKRSGAARKAIDAWFIDVRKRIGWSSLRKSRYQGKKKDIIRDATEFFQGDRQVDAALEFASIHGAAKELYSGKLGPGTLASHIGALIDRKRGTSSAPRSSTTSEDFSSSSDERCSVPILHPPSTKTSLFKRTRLEEDRDELGHDSRPFKRQRVHHGPAHIPMARCNATHSSNFEPKNCLPTKSSSADGVLLVRSEGHVNLGFTDCAIVPPAEKSGFSTPCIPTFSGLGRFVSDPGPRPSNGAQSKTPKSQSMPDLLFAQTLETPSEWNFDQELSHLITPSCDLGDITAYDVEAFDFGSFNFGDPLQMSHIVGADSFDPVPAILSSTISNMLDNSHNEAIVGMSGFSLTDPSSISSFNPDSSNSPATVNGLTQPPELSIPDHESGSPAGADRVAGWSFGSVDNLFRDVLQTPPISSAVSRSCVLREEKKKKLQQLADMRLAQEQLEAEIATLDGQFS